MTALFINTRPTHRSTALNELGNVAGVCVVNLPLLAICNLPINECEQKMMNDLLDGAYQTLIITSVESAKRAIDYLKKIGYQHANDLPQSFSTPIIAVGSATAKALQAFGLSVILPITANNESMLELAVINKLQKGDKVLIWRGMGGRRLLQDTLSAKGVNIDAIRWYKRVTPPDLKDTYHAIAPQLVQAHNNNTPIFILIASQMAFENWQNLACPFAKSIRYLTLGERLFELVKNTQPNAQILLIDELGKQHIESMITQITSTC
ncbi:MULTISPECIES: uroporphyrinogen-III synthase [unclassified Moraxella]|uniref:uroporphyrinogen-III synthase n=1 Tax=unclassified Moraxella TaxID=2685852 RepID=UPI002B415B8A|nr:MULTISPECIES: uroporphyrinogen-III synthase [unclassified Moraxella]